MKYSPIFLLIFLAMTSVLRAQNQSKKPVPQQIKPVNSAELPQGRKTIAIINVNLIDGRGGRPISNGCVLIKENKILDAVSMGSIKIPEGAEIIDGKGMSLLPGLIDSHFHLPMTCYNYGDVTTRFSSNAKRFNCLCFCNKICFS